LQGGVSTIRWEGEKEENEEEKENKRRREKMMKGCGEI